MSADDKEIFDFSNYSTKSKYYDDSNKLVIDKMKYEGATGESVGLKSKMCSILVDGNSEHKKAKDMNRNIAATTSHNKYNDVLFNNKCLRNSMNRIKSKDHGIGTYEIN